MNNDDVLLVYITAADRPQALAIGTALVEERLAACANILDGMRSVYWWEGAVRSDNEAVLIMKTRRSLLPELTRRTQSLHTYSCPCIVAVPIVGGNAEFLSWILRETRCEPA